ncbi:adenylate cyclase [Nocardioides baekrokdamisoli]|uniref:Adenylate cyclase n=1 Tax=Nocardioides baekrokdamisoli TaxID=1804624 RepID=A0A3G9IYW7_9ACTN|nr:adenylate/guanylate cyclase domain-containing protein [Nocardioides baekrokdamisoli]BBH16538.1 adenylate cyclase [Nocardioides baekrokdamisoli]
MSEIDPLDALSGVPVSGRYTSDEVARAVGLPVEHAKRLWRALGFPESGGQAMFLEQDIHALRTAAELVRTGLVDLDLAVNLARGLGQTMARLADWQVTAILHRVEALGADEEQGNLIAAAIGMTDDFVQPFETLLIYAWHRHLDAAIARVEAGAADDHDLHTIDLTVGFADIVSFTALSNRMAEGEIGDLVEVFESRCADVISSNRGRVIKSIGDSVLFVNHDPIAAYDTAQGIIQVIGRDPRMPDVRVGLASGSVVARQGDVFGPPVNLASRLTAVARRNRIIVDDATAALLPADQFETRRLAARPVRGFGIVEPVAVTRL